jgi:DNA-binding CsgD family transcriptional regulator
MMSILIDFLDRLAAATTVEAVRETTKRFFAAQGHPCITYEYRAKPDHAGQLPASFASGEVGKSLLQRDVCNDPEQCRLIFEVATACQRPFYWQHLVSSRQGGRHDAVRAENRLLVDCGWARDAQQLSALIVPLHHTQGSARGLLSIFSELPALEFDRSLQARGPALCLAALTADEKMRALARSTIDRLVALSPREKECLEWLSAGLRNDRIAERMGITRPTVELHLARARRKLGATTREQALVRAVLLGLVNP